jgi:hypothetical protein
MTRHPGVHAAALDVLAKRLREDAVSVAGAQKPWASLSEQAKRPWRSRAEIYLDDLAHAGIAVFRRHHHTENVENVTALDSRPQTLNPAPGKRSVTTRLGATA